MTLSLVQRLRNHAMPDPSDEREVLHAPLLTEAADEIERLNGIIAMQADAFAIRELRTNKGS